MKLAHTRNKPARIEMLPLIDIVFLLLVFFIYAMLSMAVHHGLQLDLPQSTQATTTEESPISLSITNGKTGIEFFLNQQPLTQVELHQRLTDIARDKDNPQLLVFAEKNITYQQLYQALDELKACGLTKISLQASRE
ncbi:ExbD/TolR family protein [Desulfogranum marinum]|jgi:biopolymer transport protein ExbD|uniref:ExbD/TolR family protein n=1 Tax=Desulfogranum marinum TaxID=453220 RepID=UPI00196365E3|nr:biopolymer transporter ExbD [Desulfogranum marinum]MBM9513773.1 biopolymer transporter ExbD [Desulfogranum marinum]